MATPFIATRAYGQIITIIAAIVAFKAGQSCVLATYPCPFSDSIQAKIITAVHCRSLR